MPSMLVSKLPLMLPTVFGGITVLLATLTLETCNLDDAATLIGKKLSLECHLQRQAHSLVPSKSLRPIGKFFNWSKTDCVQESLIPKCKWNIIHLLTDDMLPTYASEMEGNSALIWSVNRLEIFLLNQCVHDCTINYRLCFIAINTF